MKFALAFNISPEITKFIETFHQVSSDINSITSKEEYGEDIDEMYIGINCVSPQFEPFFKPRKPKYTKEKREYVKDGIKFSSERMLEYEIKLDFESMKNLDQESAKKRLCNAILDSIHVIEKIKGISKFNFEHFKKDLEMIFKEQNSI